MKTLIGVLLLSATEVLASGSGQIEVKALGIEQVYQAINVSILAGILFWFLKPKVIEMFKSRSIDLQKAVTESKRLKEEAEVQKEEIQNRLRKLSATANETLARVQAEANALKARMKEETAKAINDIQREAKLAAEREILKAQGTLYEEALESSLSQARKLLTEGVVATDQKRLQKEFVEKIEAVH